MTEISFIPSLRQTPATAGKTMGQMTAYRLSDREEVIGSNPVRMSPCGEAPLANGLPVS